jgi:hypothetical protein
MLRLRVSKTLPSLSIAFVLLGPGIAVFTMGSLGSSGKKDVADDAYALRIAVGAIRDTFVALQRAIEDRARLAERAKEAMAIVL